MANAVYPKFKELCLGAGGNLSAGTVIAILVDLADYTYSSAHDFYDDLPGAARVAVSSALGAKTITNGVFDHADFTWSAVSGDVSEAVIWVVDTAGAESTDPLVVYHDTGMTGIPVTPSGGDIDYVVNASGIFA